MIYILKEKNQSRKSISFMKSISLVLKSNIQLKDTKYDLSIDIKYYKFIFYSCGLHPVA
jgi:hypothetical protein